jgi:hypothetical protein
MKRTLICLMSVLVLLTGVLFAHTTADCEVYGTDDMANVVRLDYHPDYGYVGKNDMPMSPTGFDPTNVDVQAMFPGETIVDYSIHEEVFTGVALVQHMAPDGTVFHAWHRYENERVARIEVTVERVKDDVVVHIRIGRLHIWACSNGVVSIWYE